MNVLRFSPRRACIGAVLFSLSTLAFGVGKTYAQAAVTQAPNIVRPEVDIAFNQLLDAPLVKQAFQALEADHARAVQDMRDLTEIEAPPFGERKKAEEFLARLRAIGLANAQIDPEGNVVAARKGTSNGPTLLVSAHLDTVFSEGGTSG
jgi:tripeptide aminopeptidase